MSYNIENGRKIFTNPKHFVAILFELIDLSIIRMDPSDDEDLIVFE